MHVSRVSSQVLNEFVSAGNLNLDVRKRPAASSSSKEILAAHDASDLVDKSDEGECEIVEVVDSESQEKIVEYHHEASVEIKIVPGHHGASTLVARTSAKDKAQILQIGDNCVVGTSFSPLQVAEEVSKGLATKCETLRGPVAKAQWLPALRKSARELKHTLLIGS